MADEEKKTYLKVGKYIPGNKESGTPEVIEREFYSQGMIFKDEEAYYNKDHPDRICYIPELDDDLYSRNDFLKICNGQEEIADVIFFQCDWQHPETCLQDQWFEELDVCPKCGKWFWCYGKMECPYCGSLHNPDAIDGDEEPWYTEKWYTEDLKNALEGAEIEITEENLEKLRAGCRNIFDDKSERYEMLLDKVRELFKEG